jgi:NitT/TauT family transport system substrate-binding protein
MSIRNVVGLAAALAALLTAVPALAQEKVTYNMAWLPQGSSIGVIVAQDRGYFRELGLDTNIVRGYGGNRTANELDQGQYEFAYVDPISLILNRSNGGHIKMVGAINTRWPAGVCYVAQRNHPKSIDDLKGLTLGGGAGSPVHNVVPAWLEMNGKPRDFIKLVRLDPAVIDTSFMEGKTDLAECWQASNRPVLAKLAKTAGVQVGWLNYADYGLNAYGSGFATSDAMIQKKPETVRKFLHASYRGFQEAFANPEAAADTLVKMFPASDRAIALAQIKETADIMTDPQAKAQGLGYLREDRMSSTLNFVDKAYDVKGKVKLSDIYTNAFLK